MKFDQDPAPSRSRSVLPPEDVAAILAAEDESFNPSQVGYYEDIPSLAEKVRSSKWWSIGEVFVFADKQDRYIVMKQIAPSSCEMLVISPKGYQNVITAYAFAQDELVTMLEEYLQ